MKLFNYPVYAIIASSVFFSVDSMAQDQREVNGYPVEPPTMQLPGQPGDSGPIIENPNQPPVYDNTASTPGAEAPSQNTGDSTDSGTVAGSLNTNSGNTNSNNDYSTNDYVDNSVSSNINEAADFSKQVGVAYTPGLTTGGVDTCLGSVTSGIGFAGGSISGGKTVTDESCVRIKNAKLFASLGFNNAAVSLLLQDDNNLIAMYQAYPMIVEQLGFKERAESLVTDYTDEAGKVFKKFGPKRKRR